MADAGHLAEIKLYNEAGVSISGLILPYLKTLTYSDPADGSSDSLELELFNEDDKWFEADKYPRKGDKISGSITITSPYDDVKINHMQLGTMTLDTAKFSGSNLTLVYVSAPAHTSFNTLERTQTWENATLDVIGREIAERYGLGFEYNADPLFFGTLTQDKKTDSAFLYDMAGRYGLKMKIFKNAVYIYDAARAEAQTIPRPISSEYFLNRSMQYEDSLDGVYNGARVSYRAETEEGSGEDVSIYVGSVPEDDPNARVLKVSETADSAADAELIARAAINKSNEEAVTLSCEIDSVLNVYGASTMYVHFLGEASGLYFVDKSTYTISGSQGITHSVEMHKVQERI